MTTVKIKVNYHFYLHHEPTKTLIEKLTWTQMNSLCRTLRSGEWADWKVWVAELELWFDLTDLIQEILKRSDGLFRKPPVPERGKDGRTMEHQLVDAPEDKRQHPRYDIKLPVMLDITGSLINTFTSDISESGVRLKEEIPLRKEISHLFLYYRSGNALIEFKARPVMEGTSKLTFARLQLISCNHIDLWRSLIKRAAQDSENLTE